LNVLQLLDVYKSFDHVRGPLQVLNGVNAQFQKGESVAIVGPSGSGKSTLLSLMAGLDRPTTGSVRCLERSLENMSERDLTRFRAESLSIVFQQFRLMPHMNAVENVSLPLSLTGNGLKYSSERAEKALAEVGLDERGDHFPRELSGGECQRVAIARALVTQPAVLLADEPSGSLDPHTGSRVIDLLFNLTQEKSTILILVTHDLELAARCNRTLRLTQGQLHES